MFQIGLVGYTSQKLYGPDDKDGTRLLASGQNAINVIGEAYASLKVLDQTLTGYRQIIHRPFNNAQDNRMVPNAFEAYTLTGATKTVHYAGGYIDKIKTRNSNSSQPPTRPRERPVSEGIGFGRRLPDVSLLGQAVGLARRPPPAPLGRNEPLNQVDRSTVDL